MNAVGKMELASVWCRYRGIKLAPEAERKWTPARRTDQVHGVESGAAGGDGSANVH